MSGLYRWVRHGTPDELEPLLDDETSVSVDAVVSDDVHQRIARLLAARPDARLEILAGEDLEMLRWYPRLRALGAHSLRLRSIEGLGHVASTLERLSLGDTLRPVSLRPIGQVTGLHRLGISGTWRDPATISGLTALERLGIGAIDVEMLLPLRELRRFASGLGTVQHLERLPEVGALELVELYRLRGPHDLSALARIPTLRYLLLASTRSITSLPSFADSPELRWVALDEMRGITDLRPIADAPNLETLLLIGMPQLQAEDLRPLVGHPSLRAGIWGLGSMRRNAAAQDLLPLPPSGAEPMPWNKPDWTGAPHWNDD